MNSHRLSRLGELIHRGRDTDAGQVAESIIATWKQGLRMPRVWSCEVAKAVTLDPVTYISTGKEYICNSKASEQVQ